MIDTLLEIQTVVSSHATAKGVLTQDIPPFLRGDTVIISLNLNGVLFIESEKGIVSYPILVYKAAEKAATLVLAEPEE
jgi:hypothetical protein